MLFSNYAATDLICLSAKGGFAGGTSRKESVEWGENLIRNVSMGAAAAINLNLMGRKPAIADLNSANC